MFAPREELFAILLKKTEELGHQVTSSEFKQDPAMPHPNEYAFHYGSFENAAKQAYQKAHSKGLSKVAIKKTIKPLKKMPYQEIDRTHHYGCPPT